MARVFFQRVVWFLVLFCGFVGSCGGTFFSVDVLSAEGKGSECSGTVANLFANSGGKLSLKFEVLKKLSGQTKSGL